MQFELSGQATYRQLLSMGHVLASELRGVICKGQSVPVLLSRSVYQVCAILGLAKLGAVHVTRADDLAAVLFTSGTTGQPGGAVTLFEGRRVNSLKHMVTCGEPATQGITHDWGRLTSAGDVVLLGRRDSQIKIDGQRVDLGEIHDVVGSISTGAVILPIKGPTGRVRLFAFLTSGRVSDRPPGMINCLSPFDEASISKWSTPSPLPESMGSIWLNGGGTLLHQLV